MSEFAIAEVMPGKLNALVKNLMCQMGIDNPNEAVRRINAGEWAVSLVKRLTLRGEIVLPGRTDSFNPAAFYGTRTGLYVWDGFKSHILSAASRVESLLARTILSFDLTKPLNDGEIRAELPEHHVFESASAFCAYLAGMISRQPNGEDGELCSNGYANIFYVRGINSGVFAVGVYWFSDGRGWDANAYPLVDDRWYAGRRAFSSNC